jgi:hypothetical protein
VTKLRGSILDEEVIEIGKVLNYFSKLNVALVELSLPLSVGDRILIKGPHTDFEQNVESIQVDRKKHTARRRRNKHRVKTCTVRPPKRRCLQETLRNDFSAIKLDVVKIRELKLPLFD